MKKLIIFILSILIIPIAYSLNDCKSIMNVDEVPCLILLANNVSEQQCSTINISFYSNDSYIDSRLMANYTDFMCYSNFTETNYGVYTFFYGTGDSGIITITENVDNKYYLYVVALIIFFVLLFLGSYLEEGIFIIIAGMLSISIGIYLFVSGFPNLDSIFLKNAIVIILLGLGFYLIIMPSLEYIEGLE